MIAKCKRHIETLFILYCALVLFSSYGTVQGQEAIEALEEKAILKAIENISESVIRIESVGGLSKVEGTTTQLAPVTATIIAEDGYAVSSSFHFVSRPVGLIATLPDGTKCKATVVGKDKSRNLVLIKLTTDQTFELPRSANRTSISVGETVIAIGRGLSSDSINVSTGILSAKNRIWGKAFQTDAKISPVNFGGPLLNLKGELIGVLTPMSLGSEAVTARYDWYDSGVGFAIPVGDIKSRLIQLKSGISIRPGLPGFSFQNQNQFQTPLTVGFVSPGSPAASAGLRQGDIIKSANGKPTKNQAEFKHLSKPLDAGQSLRLSVTRENQIRTIQFELTGSLSPFKPVEIGVTVRLTSQGVEIKEVRNEGPADQAGILPGQIINAVHSAPIKSSMELRLAIAATPLGQTLDVQIVDQEGQILKNSIEVIPKVASIAGYPDSGQDFKSVVKSEVRLPDYSNQGFVIFPSNQQAMGLLVWLAAPGPLDLEKLTSRWTPICKKYPLAILVLESTDPKSWQSVDSEVIRAMVENLASMSSISPDRILIGGYGTGGTMASRVAFSNKSVFRGLILDDAMFSNQIEPGSPDPLSPMPILILGSSGPTSRFQKNLESNQFIVLNKSSIELVTRKAKDDFIAKWSTLVDRL